MTVHQGHRYRHNGDEVLALEGGQGYVRVRVIDPHAPLCMGRAYYVPAQQLEPLPMKYHGGQVPEERC